ncbi:MAG: hypothetical protein H6672_07225 [Anaerolineaceae bacterium]|nr:hypothetical protein [Anaerolineaceae bacterium]
MNNTELERTVLRFICDFWREHGFSPTLREISEGCFISGGNLYRHLDKLEARGFISREPGTARSIVILDESLCEPEPETDSESN